MLDILITATRTYNYFQQLIHFNKFTMEYTMVYTGENTISIHLVYSWNTLLHTEYTLGSYTHGVYLKNTLEYNTCYTKCITDEVR